MKSALLVVSVASLFALPAAAGAQVRPEDVPQRPHPAAVVEAVNEILDASPEERLEVPGLVRLVYRRIPLDVHTVAVKFGDTLSAAERPRGGDMDRYVRIFEPQIQEVLDERLANVGELEVLAPVTWARRKTLAPKKYVVGIGLQGGRPAALVLRDPEQPRERPLVIKLKQRRPELQPDAQGSLLLQLPRHGETAAFDVLVALRGAEALTATEWARAAGEGDEGGDEGD